MKYMRIIIEAREGSAVNRVELEAMANNWMDEAKNNTERRQGVLDAANGLLRALNLDEIVDAE